MTTATKPEGRWITGGDINATQRTLKLLRAEGYRAGVTERRIPRIDHGPDAYAQTLAEQLDRIAEEMGATRPWAEAMEAAAIKLRAMATGPFYLPGGHTEDLFGFCDILAINSSFTVAVQCTSRAKITGHVRAYRRDETGRQAILNWVAGPGRIFYIFGWGRREVPNTTKAGTKIRWDCEQRLIEPADLEDKPF